MASFKLFITSFLHIFFTFCIPADSSEGGWTLLSDLLEFVKTEPAFISASVLCEFFAGLAQMVRVCLTV